MSMLCIPKICIQESGNSRISYQAVSAFDQSMPFILEAHVFYWDVALAQSRHDLLGLANGHAGVVRAMNDEKGRCDAINVVDGRDAFQKLAVVFQAAVFRLAQLASPGAGMLQEGDEVGDAYDIYGGCPQVRIGGDGRQDHEAAVAAAHHCDTSWISYAAVLQPQRGVLQIGHRVHTQTHIIEA